MYRFLFSLLTVLVLAGSSVSCGGKVEKVLPSVRYYVRPDVASRASDIKMADYLKRHLQRRCMGPVIATSPGDSTRTVIIHVGDDFGGDYTVRHDGNELYIGARDERTMTWLLYQFIKRAGKLDPAVRVDDLPPCIFPERDTVATFPFVFRDVYMPTNQNPDMTQVLGLNNIESDWGIWGHNLSRVLGASGESSYGFTNMDQELFARTGGAIYKDQFCFSSDKLYELTVKYILNQFGDGREHPALIMIGPNDNEIACECRRCQAAGNTPGNAMPTVLRFIERLAARFPNHQFFIPGYLTTSQVPTRKLPKNVGVFISAMDYPRVYNDANLPKAQAFFKKLEDWKKVTRNIYVWDYICNFDDYLSPYPILYVMQHRFQRYIEEGVTGIFLNGSGYFFSTLQEMYTFVLADLLINPYHDVDSLVEEYFADAMPNIGQYVCKVVLTMEQHTQKSGKELPMYGGMEEALNSYLFERGFHEAYIGMQTVEDRKMTHRERVIYNKMRQDMAFTFLEICRYHGLGEGGFMEFVDVGSLSDEWQVKPDVLEALDVLEEITPDADIAILNSNEDASPDHMDRVNEAGVYLADYQNECEIWLKGKWWEDDLLLNIPLTVHYDGNTEVTKKLTDGVNGISNSYHWGWQIYPQKDFRIELPAEKVEDATSINIGFLNFERHRLSPPESVEIWVDGTMALKVTKEEIGGYFEEGEKVLFRGKVAFGYPQRVEIRIKPSHTRDLAIDEVYIY